MKIIIVLLLIIIALLIAIYRKLYWIKIEASKTDTEKEAKRKQLVLEIEKLSFGFKQAMEEADKIEDPKKREKAQKYLWKKFWS